MYDFKPVPGGEPHCPVDGARHDLQISLHSDFTRVQIKLRDQIRQRSARGHLHRFTIHGQDQQLG